MINQNNQGKPITVTFPDGRIASAIASLVIRKKPIGWGKKSYSAYYKEAYGKWVKGIFDAMMTDGKPKIIPFDESKRVKNSTRYLQFQQGKMFLLEQMDSEGKYKVFADSVEVDKTSGRGIVIDFRKVDDTMPDVTDVVSFREKPRWKKELDVYLEEPNPDGKPFIRESLALTDVEVQQQIDELGGIEGLMFDVTNSSVKVYKGL